MNKVTAVLNEVPPTKVTEVDGGVGIQAKFVDPSDITDYVYFTSTSKSSIREALNANGTSINVTFVGD